jgi:hypothetical protein
MSYLSKAWRTSRFYRWLTPKRLPELIIIGAQKSGTSALFSYLAQSERLARSVVKELDFFGSDLRYAQGLRWYSAQWSSRRSPEAKRFEASPYYLLAPRAPQRIRACLPNVKLIAVLRDPVERAYSGWRMYRQELANDPNFYRRWYSTRFSAAEVAGLVPRRADEFDDFWLAVRREADCLSRGQSMELSILEFGLYGPQLRRYFECFPREQLLVLDSEDLRNHRVPTLNRVLRFLELPPEDWSTRNLADVFVGKRSGAMPPRAGDFLREFFQDSNRLVAEMLDEPPRFARHCGQRLASA